MPIHDWSRVEASIFHSFHHSWILEIARALNGGLLPPEFYALIERPPVRSESDVLLEAVHQEVWPGMKRAPVPLPARPRRFVLDVAPDDPSRLVESSVAVRRDGVNDVVAVVEIVSRGHKANRATVEQFVADAHELFAAGIHLVVADIHAPCPYDPRGMNETISEAWATGHDMPRPHSPLTVAYYEADCGVKATLWTVAVGSDLPDVPLRLRPDLWVPVPLEATYRLAFDVMPRHWRELLQPEG